VPRPSSAHAAAAAPGGGGHSVAEHGDRQQKWLTQVPSTHRSETRHDRRRWIFACGYRSGTAARGPDPCHHLRLGRGAMRWSRVAGTQGRGWTAPEACQKATV